jgi:hypothetical protein
VGERSSITGREKRYFCTLQRPGRLWGQPGSYANGTGYFSLGGWAAGVLKLTIPFHLVPCLFHEWWSYTSLLLKVLMEWCLIKYGRSFVAHLRTILVIDRIVGGNPQKIPVSRFSGTDWNGGPPQYKWESENIERKFSVCSNFALSNCREDDKMFWQKKHSPNLTYLYLHRNFDFLLPFLDAWALPHFRWTYTPRVEGYDYSEKRQIWQNVTYLNIQLYCNFCVRTHIDPTFRI